MCFNVQKGRYIPLPELQQLLSPSVYICSVFRILQLQFSSSIQGNMHVSKHLLITFHLLLYSVLSQEEDAGTSLLADRPLMTSCGGTRPV